MNSIKTIFLLLLMFLAGCQFQTAGKPSINYYLNPSKNLADVGRVAMIELNNESDFPQISTDATEAICQTIQKKQLFGLSIIRKSNPAWQSFQSDINETYTLEQLSAMRKASKCDAILIGSTTKFKPYPHMTIGLRLQLIHLTDGQLLWAIEQIWDTTDKATQDRIKNYYSHQNFLGMTTSQDKLGTISSLKFVKFVAHEVAETLQPKR